MGRLAVVRHERGVVSEFESADYARVLRLLAGQGAGNCAFELLIALKTLNSIQVHDSLRAFVRHYFSRGYLR